MIDGDGIHHLVWRFHLDPAVHAEVQENDVRFSAGGREAWFLPISSIPEMDVKLAKGWISPSYGVKIETSVVRLEVTARLPLAFGFVFSRDRRAHAARAEVISLLEGLS